MTSQATEQTDPALMSEAEFLAACGLKPGEVHEHEYKVDDDGTVRKVGVRVITVAAGDHTLG